MNNEYPINCGYCYPCLIRKSSLLDIKDFKYSFPAETEHFINQYGESEKASDLRAVISAVYKYRKIQDSNIQSKIRLAGCLTEEEVNKFLYIYTNNMQNINITIIDAIIFCFFVKFKIISFILSPLDLFLISCYHIFCIFFKEKL